MTQAILDVAHSIMVSVFHMLSRNTSYRELGANCFDEQQRHYIVARLTLRIEHLDLQRHLQNMLFQHKGLRVRKKSLSFVA
jgi:hypothetical protein